MPIKLLKDADVVVRLAELTIERHSLTSIEVQERTIYTVLNSDGIDDVELFEYYSGKSLKSISITLFDAAGKKVKTYRRKDFSDYPVFGGSVATDDRFLHFEPSYGTFPFTIELNSTRVYRDYLSLIGFQPILGERMALQKAALHLVADPEFEFQTQEVVFQPSVSTQLDNGRVRYTWSLENFGALQFPNISLVPSHKLLPRVSFFGHEMQYDGHQGNFSTWESYNKWAFSLWQDRSELVAEDEQFINQLRQQQLSEREMASRIYSYVQQKTRYVSVQLGLGGWQPFSAKYVAENGFGDCKALTNYTKALMTAAGLQVHPLIIYAGRKSLEASRLNPAEVDIRFNHVILLGVFEDDTTLLECTSQTAPFGWNGAFTANRDAFLLNESTGKLFRTPAISQRQNQVHHTVEVFLTKNHWSEATVTTELVGRACDKHGGSSFDRARVNEQKKTIDRAVGLPSFELIQHEAEYTHTNPPRWELQADLRINGFASWAGNGSRLVVVPNQHNQVAPLPEVTDEHIELMMRASPEGFHLSEGLLQTDTIRLHLPATFEPMSKMAPVEITTPFGSYLQETSLKDDCLTVTRRFDQVVGQFPWEQFAQYRQFYDQVVRADRTKLLLKRVEN